MIASITRPTSVSKKLGAILSGYRYTTVVLLVFLVLVLVNVGLDPRSFGLGSLATRLALATPIVLGAMATTVPVLSGNSGIDLSVGPTMGVTNAIIVVIVVGHWGAESPLIIVPVALLVGLGVGLTNAFLVAVIRLQPVVATLGTYLVLGGMTLVLAPTPGGSVPAWLAAMANGWSALLVLGVLLLWLLFKRTTGYEQLLAVGGDDRAAYASGVQVTAVRFASYAFGGILSGLAGLALTALLGSADAGVGATYTLTVVAAVALGGSSLAGGRGGMAGAVLGGLVLYLLQAFLTYQNVSSFLLQMSYGAVLIVSVCMNPLVNKYFVRKRVVQ